MKSNFVKSVLLLLFPLSFSQLYAESTEPCSLQEEETWNSAYSFLFEFDQKLLSLDLTKKEAVRKFALETSMEPEFNKYVQEMICYLAEQGRELQKGLNILNNYKTGLYSKILDLVKLENFENVSSLEFADFVNEFQEILRNIEFKKGEQTFNMGGVINVDVHDLRYGEKPLLFILGHELGHAIDEMTKSRHFAVRRCLSQQKNPELWADEFSAKFLLASGVSRGEILAAAREVVGLSPADDIHPDGKERMRNLEKL